MFEQITVSWNPVKGCLHDCVYCFAKQCALRLSKEGNAKYADGFKPSLTEKELTRIFVNEFVFAVQMGDLFGSWVPSEWIKKVIETINQSPTSHFLFLTKNPVRYFEFHKELPSNVVLGVTIETNRDYHCSKAPCYQNRTLLADIPWKNKLVSIEPIMDFDIDVMINGIKAIKPTIVYLGYDNHNNKLPEPSKNKTRDLIEELQTFTKVKIQPTHRNHEMGLI